MSFFGNLGRRIFPPGIVPSVSTNTLGNSLNNGQQQQPSQQFGNFFNNFKSIGIYLIILIIIIFIVLLLIDRFITPVFKTKPGGPGFIPIPRRDDGTLMWKNEDTRIQDNSVIANMAFNYTLALDILIQNPAAFAQGPRVIFWRGPPTVSVNPLNDYNIAIYLAKDTNDLTVSVMTSSNDTLSNSVNATIANVPTFKPFRIVAVVMDKLFEVYMNGRLVITKPLLSPPRASFQFFNPPQQNGAMAASVRNLHVWARPFQPGEIRDIQPPLSTFKNIDSTMSSCFSASNVINTLTNQSSKLAQNTINTLSEQLR